MIDAGLCELKECGECGRRKGASFSSRCKPVVGAAKDDFPLTVLAFDMPADRARPGTHRGHVKQFLAALGTLSSASVFL